MIASFLGKPLLADDITLKKTRLSFARIFVEIDLDFSFLSSIPSLIDGKFSFDLPVEYQWKPLKCENCKVFGHTIKNCTRNLKIRWAAKKAIKPQSRSIVGVLEGTLNTVNDVILVTGAENGTKENGSIVISDEVVSGSESNATDSTLGSSLSGKNGLKSISAGEKMTGEASTFVLKETNTLESTRKILDDAKTNKASIGLNLSVVSGKENAAGGSKCRDSTPNTSVSNENRMQTENGSHRTPDAKGLALARGDNEGINDWTVVKGKKNSPP